MRVNLILQYCQLTFSSFILLSDNLIHQFFNLLIGFLNRMAQMPDLCGTANINIRLSAGLIGFY